MPDRFNYVPSPLALFKLRLFGQAITDCTGEIAYLVGSALHKPDYRDVDVRVLLDDERFATLFGDEEVWIKNGWLRLANMGLSALGAQMTGLPIDAQFQQTTEANAHYDGPRHPLIPLREPPR